MPSVDKPAPGLRERKKAKTRVSIQRHALRLFRKRGYYETTIEQIAEEAEVSPSTFFRYFPTKEDVVIWDELDPLIIEAFKAQPSDLGPIPAFRNAMNAVFSSLNKKQMEEQKQRSELINSVPELRARVLEQFADLVEMLSEVIAERAKRSKKDFAIRNLAGALVGVLMSVMPIAAEDPKSDLLQIVDKSLAHLEAGLPL